MSVVDEGWEMGVQWIGNDEVDEVKKNWRGRVCGKIRGIGLDDVSIVRNPLQVGWSFRRERRRLIHPAHVMS